MKYNMELVSFVLVDIYPGDVVVNVETCRESDDCSVMINNLKGYLNI
jgi:hypothetical protein